MPQLTAEGRRELEAIAERQGFSPAAAEVMLAALVAGHGSQAQFNHPELGGLGQWSRGGMLMIGDMFNNGLKSRVDALASDLSVLLDRTAAFGAASGQSLGQSQSQSGTGPAGVSLFVRGSGGGSGTWWPADLGAPSSTGAQNNLRYAVFPGTRRLAIDQGGRVSLYDTGDHLISGVSPDPHLHQPARPCPALQPFRSPGGRRDTPASQCPGDPGRSHAPGSRRNAAA